MSSRSSRSSSRPAMRSRTRASSSSTCLRCTASSGRARRRDILSIPWDATQAIFALVGASVLLALVLLREMPRARVAVALLPVCALGSVIVAGEGVSRTTSTRSRRGCTSSGSSSRAWLAERTRVAQRRLALLRLLPLAFGVVFALRVATSMEDSPHIRATWLLWGARTPADRSTREYFARFPEPDFFPYEMRQTADVPARAHAADRPRADLRHGPVRPLPRRAPLGDAVHLRVRPRCRRGARAAGPGGKPDDAQAEHIRAIRDAHEADLLARLDREPPAAFVFFDKSPLMTESDAQDDFERHCPAAARWVSEHYRRFGQVRARSRAVTERFWHLEKENRTTRGRPPRSLKLDWPFPPGHTWTTQTAHLRHSPAAGPRKRPRPLCRSRRRPSRSPRSPRPRHRTSGRPPSTSTASFRGSSSTPGSWPRPTATASRCSSG